MFYRTLLGLSVAVGGTASAQTSDPFANDPAPAAESTQPETVNPALPEPAAAEPAVVEDEAVIDVMNRLLVRQWIRLEPRGVLRGAVLRPNQGDGVYLANVRVGLVDETARVLETITNGSGEFEIQGVQPGTYGLFVIGEGVLASYALHALPPRAGTAAKQEPSHLKLAVQPMARLSNDLRVSAGPASMDAVRQSIRSYLPSSPMTAYSPNLRDFQQDPLGNDREVTDDFRITLNNNGAFKGRLRFPATESGRSQANELNKLNVLVISGDSIEGRSEVQGNGGFEISGLNPGTYSLVVAGETGFAALGFEALPPANRVVSNQGVNARLVSAVLDDEEATDVEVNVEVTPSGMTGPITSFFTGAAPPPPGIPGIPPAGLAGGPLGGAGGGLGGAGAGAAGGAGGFGALLPAAALAGIAAAAGSDNNNSTPPVASPAIP